MSPSILTSDAPVAIVTGSAAGIGYAIAAALIGRGYRVVVSDRELDAARAAAASLPEAPSPVARRCDVQSSNEVAQLVEWVGNEFGRLDAVVNNAGFVDPAATHDVTDDSWTALLDTHLTGTFRVSRAALPLLVSSECGSVVNISSVCAHRGFPARASYNAAKAAIEALTRTLAVEWAPAGVRVNAVAPGFILTENARRMYEAGAADADVRRQLVPMGRLGSPEEVGDAVAWLTAAATYVTGQVVVVDGGFLADGRTGPDPRVPDAALLKSLGAATAKETR